MPSDSRGLSRLPASRYEPQARILRLQRELHAAANSANVSIYAVDPSRLIDVSGISNPRQELGNSLRHAAAETGGKHFIAWADFGEVVEEIQQDSGRYYLLSYPGPAPGGDGRYHEIRVEVNRPGVSIRSKEGYMDYPEEERRSRFVSAALMLPGSVNDLPIAAEMFRGAPGGDLTDVMVAVATDGKDLQIGSDDTGGPIQRIEVHGAVLDEDHDMEVVAEMHREVTEALPGAQAAPQRWLRSKQEWTLRAGRYDLRVMVLDTVSGRIGTTQVAIEIPKVDGDAWSTGDVLLVETPAGAEPVPIVRCGRVRSRAASRRRSRCGRAPCRDPAACPRTVITIGAVSGGGAPRSPAGRQPGIGRPHERRRHDRNVQDKAEGPDAQGVPADRTLGAIGHRHRSGQADPEDRPDSQKAQRRGGVRTPSGQGVLRRRPQ
jgi:hypothetical protein